MSDSIHPTIGRYVEVSERCFNVAFEGPSGATVLYLGMNSSYEQARQKAEIFAETYVGKPRPDGKGFYQFTNPRVVLMTEEPQ